MSRVDRDRVDRSDRGDRSGNRLSAGGWCAAGLLVAVAAAVDPWGFRPFTTARWAVVGVLVCVAAAATRRRCPGRLLVAGWAGLLLCLVAATAWGVDPLMAVVGHPRRHLGLAGWVVCGLAFAAGTGLGTVDARRGLGRAAVVAGIVTGTTAIADLAGWDPAAVVFADGRIGGLLGQPVYLGAAMLLLVPVALGVAADPQAGAAWRWAAGVAAAGGAVALVASQTRGAWLGAVVALAAARPRVVRRRNRGRAPLPLPVTVAVAVALAVTAGLAALVGPVGDRLVATFDPSGSARGRLDEWAVAASVVADHPLAGVGPEGYRVVAPSHIDAGYARRHGRDEVVDRAHNGPLDMAVSAGVPAAALYVVLLGGVVVRCRRLLRQVPAPDPVVAGAAAGVVAWVTQQAVSFPVAEVDPAAWLLAGVVAVTAPGARGRPGVGRSAGEELSPRGPTPRQGRQGRQGRCRALVRSALGVGIRIGIRVGIGTGGAGRASTVRRGAAVERVVAAGLGCVLAVGGLRAVAADRELRRAERQVVSSSGGAGVAAVQAADRATALRPDDIDAWYAAARVASSARPGLLGVDAALERVEGGLRRSPRDPALRGLEEALLVERALRSGLPRDLRAARRAAQALIARDPAGPAHHRHLGLVLAAEGETAPAAAALRRALALDPGDPIARQTLEDLSAPARSRAMTERSVPGPPGVY